jgi:subtilisin family serine protease
MGGLASKAWADLVNKAYDQGVFIVTAAGNNYNKLPTRRLVFPARFNRVVAACGATYDYSPYAKPDGEGSFSLMEGNHGPKSLMRTAIAAFTPNVPWAIWKKKDLFGIRGNGTSSATPQIASAAALYYCKHYEALESLPDRYRIVEARRIALFSTALN